MTQNKKKPRKDYVIGTTDEVTSISVTYDPLTDSMILNDAVPASVRMVRSYERESGKDKVLLSIPGSGNSGSFNSLNSLKAFERLVAVDTNSLIVDGQKLSVTAAYVVSEHIDDYKKVIPYVPLCMYLSIDVADYINPETWGWHLVLKNHIDSAYFDQSKKLGLISDSELGDMPAMNRRQRPYFERHFLPEFVTLIYASDADVKSLANTMLRACHVLAKRATDELLRRPEGIPKLNNGGEFCKGWSLLVASPK